MEDIQVYNETHVDDDKERGHYRRGGRNHYVCHVCGRVSLKKYKIDHVIYCKKHAEQVRRHGRALDDNPRGPADPNRIVVIGDDALIDLYDDDMAVVARAVIDADDLDLVRYFNWRLSPRGVVTASRVRTAARAHLANVVLDAPGPVEFLDGDMLDCRRSNLVVHQTASEDVATNVKGVRRIDDGCWEARVRVDGRTVVLGHYWYVEEAIYARRFGELELFGKPMPEDATATPMDLRRESIEKYVSRKVQRLQSSASPRQIDGEGRKG